MVRDESHHHMYRKTVEGVTHMVTKISHSGNQINASLGKRMAAQCVLQLQEFWQLVDCTLSQEAWDDLVRERCVNGKNPFMQR